jgi:predicted lipase
MQNTILQYFGDKIEMELVLGSDDKVYAVFLYFPQYRITILCWINLRYFTQWRCVVNTTLVKPFFLKDKKFSGKCWTCLNYFYELVHSNVWKVWKEKFRHRTDQFVIAGHSLGGSMAPIAALDFCLNDSFLNEKNLFVYISGTPRCGDENFSKEYNILIPNTWNVMNTYDLVTLTPTNFSNFSSHVGTPIYFSLSHQNGFYASHLLKTYLEYFEQECS